MALPIKKIAVVGTGVIGSSWTTLFLAKGYQVIVGDPAPNAKTRLSEYIRHEWSSMSKIGLSSNANPDSYEFVEDITKHLHDVDFVQENAPERTEFKAKLIADLDKHLPNHAIIASSSSGIPSSKFVTECKIDSSRVLIGHPFNPPHLIPLVEVVPHPETSQAAIDRTMAFYKTLGKTPILIKKEIPGFVANRLQAAVLCEAYSLVSRGIASPEDVDLAMSTGPGLRWALAGPYMTNVLGGGGNPDSFRHFMEHLGPEINGWKQDMDQHPFSFDQNGAERLNAEVDSWIAKTDLAGVKAKINDGLIELLKLKGSKSKLV